MSKQILLADDSVTMHKVVQITFASEDYQVTAVKSADEAIARARELRPDVVLADAGMPGKTGYDVCAALRADPQLAAIPCLILTGNFVPYDEDRGARVGADGFMVKPFDSQAMIDKVAEVTTQRRPRTILAAQAPVAAAQARSEEPTRATSPPPGPADSASRRPAPTRPEVVDDEEISFEPPPRVRRDTEPAMPAAGSGPEPISVSEPMRPAARAPQPEPSRPAPARSSSTSGMRPLPSKPAMPAAELGSGASAALDAGGAPGAMTFGMPEPVGRPVGRTPVVAMPLNVPQMPRPSMIPHTPTPAPQAPGAKPIAQRTLMGMPAVQTSSLTPPPESTPPSRPTAPPWAQVVRPAEAPARPEPSRPEPRAPAEPPPPAARVHPAEYEAIAKLSREVIERVVWEVVPDLAETMIREQLDRLVRERKQ